MAAPPSLSRLESALRRAARDLDGLGLRWALVGGLAVSARAEPRFTRDIDVVVAVATDAEAERAVRDVQARGYRVQTVVEQEATGRLAAVRLLPVGEGDDGVVLDVLFAASGIEREVAAAAETLDLLPGLRVAVATLAHLVALKILARDDRNRPQDRVDLVALLRVATPLDVERVRTALALGQARGFQRDRDLGAQLDELLAERGGRS